MCECMYVPTYVHMYVYVHVCMCANSFIQGYPPQAYPPQGYPAQPYPPQADAYPQQYPPGWVVILLVHCVSVDVSA